MGQTSDGAKKAAKTSKTLYGEDFYRKAGATGGSKRTKKGFAKISEEKHREISSRGGRAKKGYRKEPTG